VKDSRQSLSDAPRVARKASRLVAYHALGPSAACLPARNPGGSSTRPDHTGACLPIIIRKVPFPKVMICNSRVLQPTSLQEFAFVPGNGELAAVHCLAVFLLWQVSNPIDLPRKRMHRIRGFLLDARAIRCILRTLVCANEHTAFWSDSNALVCPSRPYYRREPRNGTGAHTCQSRYFLQNKRIPVH
jgi:hypothetical protein